MHALFAWRKYWKTNQASWTLPGKKIPGFGGRRCSTSMKHYPDSYESVRTHKWWRTFEERIYRHHHDGFHRFGCKIKITSKISKYGSKFMQDEQTNYQLSTSLPNERMRMSVLEGRCHLALDGNVRHSVHHLEFALGKPGGKQLCGIASRPIYTKKFPLARLINAWKTWQAFWWKSVIDVRCTLWKHDLLCARS